MSEKNDEEINVEIKSNNEENDDADELNSEHESEISELEQPTIDELNELLLQEKQKVAEYEEKLRHTLADFQNLERKTNSDIENGINIKMARFMLDFLQIYDDFTRAKNAFTENKINTEGLNSILKNMDLLLTKYNVSSIDAIGEIFDPKLHEAISIIEDPELDDDTITKEIRKGYISHNRVIRPTLVEISKKSKSK